MSEHADIVRVGFTGTQQALTGEQKKSLFDLLSALFSEGAEFHHGDCVGADANVHEIASVIGYRIVVHPPVDPSRRAFVSGADELRPEMPYAARNRDIVDDTDRLVAAPHRPEHLRSGTWSTVRYARKQDKPVVLVKPDGLIVGEIPT